MTAMEHPTGDVAPEEVQDHVDVEVGPPVRLEEERQFVIPAKAGIQARRAADWTPAFAGVTNHGVTKLARSMDGESR